MADEQNSNPIDPNNLLKPGLKSSELYVTLATVILGFLFSKLGLSDEQKKQLIPQLVPIVIAVLASASYVVSRTFLKWKAMHSVVPAIASATAPAKPDPAAPTKQIPTEPTGQVQVTDLTAAGDT